jgi:hypothetical protein
MQQGKRHNNFLLYLLGSRASAFTLSSPSAELSASPTTHPWRYELVP